MIALEQGLRDSVWWLRYLVLPHSGMVVFLVDAHRPRSFRRRVFLRIFAIFAPSQRYSNAAWTRLPRLIFSLGAERFSPKKHGQILRKGARPNRETEALGGVVADSFSLVHPGLDTSILEVSRPCL